MKIFLSKFLNKVDKKGRVSIPSGYRSILSKDIDKNADENGHKNGDNEGVILYPSFKNKSIEACSVNRLYKIHDMINNLDPYSPERDAFEAIMLGESICLSWDCDGRIILPSSLIEHAEIDGNACFVGKGSVFEIWNPDNFNDYLNNARLVAKNNAKKLQEKLDRSSLDRNQNFASELKND